MTRAVDEPRAGTAPYALGWVLIEWNRAWPAEAIDALGDVGAQLRARVGGLPVRLQLIRRPGAHVDRQRSCRVFVAHTGQQPWMERFDVGSVAQLAEVPIESATSTVAPGIGSDLDQPMVLVCAHASRDQCCAVIGRPVAAALFSALGEMVFEASHVGGHRFAGNVVCLPRGVVLGGLDPSNAVELVREASSLPGTRQLSTGILPFVRGRSSLHPHEQAAELAVADHTGDLASSVVTTTSVDPATPAAMAGSATGADARHQRDGDELARHTVVVHSSGREFIVDVRQRATGRAVLASCGDDALTPMTTFDCVELTEIRRCC
ncbi:MAG: sucrase ferredoxin [Nitriliruptoraceae bacterium]